MCRAKGIKGEVIEHDLVAENLPALDAELKASDLVVVAAPMYNLNVPTHLKNWFDLVARARVTFQYTETNPVGLIEGIRALVVSSRGGYAYRLWDRCRNAVIARCIGPHGYITDVEFIYAEGLDIQPDGKKNGLADVHRQIARITA